MQCIVGRAEWILDEIRGCISTPYWLVQTSKFMSLHYLTSQESYQSKEQRRQEAIINIQIDLCFV